MDSLQEQITSLVTAAVLQNHCILDALMAERGGTCGTLGEECCFFVNQSGIGKEQIH